MSDPRESSRCVVAEPAGRVNDVAGDPTRHVARLGAELANGIFSASRTVRIHAMNNRATQAVLQRLAETIREFGHAEGRLTVAVVTDLLVVNDVRVVVDSQHMGPVLFVIETMKERHVEEIDITPDIETGELGRFLQVFFAEPAEGDVFGILTRALSEAGVEKIRLTEWIERVKALRDTRIDRKSIQEESNKAMSRAVMFMGEVMRAVEQKHPIQVTKALRLTQRMADIIQVDESVLVGLTSIKDYDEYTFAHSVNVSVTSMVIADRLGLPRSEIAEIGIAGLLHDIGKMHVPLSVLNKTDALEPVEWEAMTRHPMLGVTELSRVRSLRMIASPLFVTLQHHVQVSGSGYPHKPGGWDLHRHTRIVAVADVYDAMTTARSYRREPLTPGKALRFIHKMGGKIFDPIVVKAFIRAMGLYPVGSAVKLDTGECAVVVRQNPDTQLAHRPVVLRIGADGPSGEPVDLAARHESGGGYICSIASTADDTVSPAHRAGCFREQ
jgi:HD-GYP domain-containing protein (c-di-GMP phosphodiesterase class II)